MSKATRKRAERTLTDVVRTLDRVRATLARRLDEMDLDAARKRGARWADRLERRARPRRRQVPGVVAVVNLTTSTVATANAKGARHRPSSSSSSSSPTG